MILLPYQNKASFKHRICKYNEKGKIKDIQQKFQTKHLPVILSLPLHTLLFPAKKYIKKVIFIKLLIHFSWRGAFLWFHCYPSQWICCGSILSWSKLYFAWFLGVVIYDDEFQTKKIIFKPKIKRNHYSVYFDVWPSHTWT